MKSFHLNNTWTLVHILKGSRLVNCKWTFKQKDNIPGTDQQRFKARLMVKCFTQKQEIDYNDVFSSVLKHRSI